MYTAVQPPSFSRYLPVSMVVYNAPVAPFKSTSYVSRAASGRRWECAGQRNFSAWHLAAAGNVHHVPANVAAVHIREYIRPAGRGFRKGDYRSIRGYIIVLCGSSQSYVHRCARAFRVRRLPAAI